MTAVGFFRRLIEAHKRGEPQGICSICSAHPAVLRAAMAQAAADGQPLLIESTVNQVNQFGGYTGMTPEDFRAFLLEVAEEGGFPAEDVVLGADHLGPYPWRGEAAEEAMRKACRLAADCVRAGYRKIHLDASMALGGDTAGGDNRTDGTSGSAARGQVTPGADSAIPPSLIAEREAALAEAAERAFAGLSGGAVPRGESSEAAGAPPVYVIGTDVPPPGGTFEEEGIHITRVEELRETVESCREAFRRRGLKEAWERVVAVVVQPGVEFGDHTIHPYRREQARELCAAARELPGVVLEGHSTDYQTRRSLRELVEDGVAILKVGPALTFAMREALFALEHIEEELRGGRRFAELSRLGAELEAEMLANSVHWRGYYQGSAEEQRLARRYSLSDRCRYYWTAPRVAAAVRRLLDNLAAASLPQTLVSQYFPHLLHDVREGWLKADPPSLIEASIRKVLDDYSFAAGP